ncbi:toprim domain-containing protein [Planctomycetota bacterium]
MMGILATQNRQSPARGIIMPDDEKMCRVSKKNPCAVCGRCDWCLVAKDGSAAICARIEDGSVKKCGDAGWLHVLRDNVHNVPNVHRGVANSRRVVQNAPLHQEDVHDFLLLTECNRRQLSPEKLTTLAISLGVSEESLMRLAVGWDGVAYTFPMSGSQGHITGIRRRFPTGFKCSVPDSRTGLFIPSGFSADVPLVIVEGESDLAAALDLGLNAIGRPNCNSKVEMTAKLARGREEVVVISDNDAPGITGGEKLAEVLALYCRIVKIVHPPDGIKDLRQWLRRGLTREQLNAIMGQAESIEVRISLTNSKEMSNERK